MFNCHRSTIFPTLPAWLLGSVALTSLLGIPPAYALSEPSPAVTPPTAQLVDKEVFLHIGPELKNLLDQKIRPLTRRTQQVVALHELLFGRQYFAIDYDNSYTKTAHETFATRSGNCLSLAALYVASARYLGMNARFQVVDIPEQWDKNRDFNIVLGHVNVRVKIPGHDATVEFLDTYTGEEAKKFKTRIITDDEATARYFNNRGAELLAAGELDSAVELLQKSVEVHPRFSESWVNLGVGYKLKGQLTQAEQAYWQARKINRHNLSAINNLHTLYLETGETQKAQQLADRIRAHQMKNPYYLASLAQHEINKHNFGHAVTYLKKAIKIQPLEADFYLLLGQTYFQVGDYAKSEAALLKAVELTRETNELEKRQKKLDALRNLMAAT